MKIITKIVVDYSEVYTFDFEISFFGRIKKNVSDFRHFSIEIYDNTTETFKIISNDDLKYSDLRDVFGVNYCGSNVYILFSTSIEATELVNLISIDYTLRKNSVIDLANEDIVISGVIDTGYLSFCNTTSYVRHSIYDAILTMIINDNTNCEIKEDCLWLYLYSRLTEKCYKHIEVTLLDPIKFKSYISKQILIGG